MVFVIKKKGENNESLFRRFTRDYINENVQDDFKKRLEYVKPSQERKEKEKNRGKGRRRPQQRIQRNHS